MVILIDTNVAINFLTGRNDENSLASAQVIDLCANEIVDGYMASHSFPTMWYVLRKRSDVERRTMLKDLCKVVGIIGASQEDIVHALNREEFSDFEDCIQDQCAEMIGADYIVTCNVRDFIHSKVQAILPSEFIQLISEQAD